MVGDLVVRGQEPLDLARRLEALHDALSSPRRLMGVLSPIVEPFVLPVLDGGHDLPLGGDQHTRCPALLLKELAEQALGSSPVATALDEGIENEAILVDGTPEP